ncbi:hypothetical protein H0X48_01550 [Candidatus Dependentiae bacterium]|nr:hypothetical protein [Candidatus Dependentiae bacterium]
MKLQRIAVALIFMSKLSVQLYATNEVRCVCNDHTVKTPECGICGQQLGSMERTQDGAACICANKLKNQEITCNTTCAKNNGWSGRFKD